MGSWGIALVVPVGLVTEVLGGVAADRLVPVKLALGRNQHPGGRLEPGGVEADGGRVEALDGRARGNAGQAEEQHQLGAGVLAANERDGHPVVLEGSLDRDVDEIEALPALEGGEPVVPGGEPAVGPLDSQPGGQVADDYSGADSGVLAWLWWSVQFVSLGKGRSGLDGYNISPGSLSTNDGVSTRSLLVHLPVLTYEQF